MINLTKKHLYKSISAILLIFSVATANSIIVRAPIGHLGISALYVATGEYVTQGQLLARLEAKPLREQKIIHTAKTKKLQNLQVKIQRRLATLTAQLNQKEVDQANLHSQFAYTQQTSSDSASEAQIKLAIAANEPHLQQLKTLVTEAHLAEKKIQDELTQNDLTLMKLDDLIQATEIKAPRAGRITSTAALNTKIPAAGYPLITLESS